MSKKSKKPKPWANFRIVEGPGELEVLIGKVLRGEFVPCEECGARLIHREPGSGTHPGVYCENGHTFCLMELRRAEEE